MLWFTIIGVSASTLIIGIVIGFFIGADYTCNVLAEHEVEKELEEIMREVNGQNGAGSIGDSGSNCIRVDYSQQMEGVSENEKVHPQTPGGD